MATDKIKQIAQSLIKELSEYEIHQLKTLLSIHLNEEREKVVQGRW